ncbi:hypothetical protein BSZ39_06255 [Bowdeniella nasicola]|uniref:CBU-0592-like domain-containing protein n=2 Tax=Bowdeniella nasicola TaxID=208480 RepID=A0A1Q5Q2L6_9ACTO|nr:hypothetical protein BSZ39_06255 [Bowdeniella nasicola]
MTAVGALGWVGCLMCLTGYFLVSSRRIMGDSLRYHALNMGGASLLAMACVTTGAWPSFFSNFIFIIIGSWVVFTTKRAYVRARIVAVVKRGSNRESNAVVFTKESSSLLELAAMK